MKELINTSTQAPFNLALEEYILKHKTEEYFFLWQDQPAVIVGRNQNTAAEINEEYIKVNGIQVVRRLTGGGAVYHDLGNLNFTMIVNDPRGVGFDFARFTRPIIQALSGAGVAAEYSGRNDITIEGKKFSGNAQYRHNGRLLHHGTLLFASDLSVLGSALKVKPEKIAAKGVKSVQSRVTNIIDYAPSLTLNSFRKLVADWLRQEYNADEEPYYLDENENQIVADLTRDKYNSWAWTYGHSPLYDLIKTRRFDWGEVEVYLTVKSGFIQDIKFYGDFFAADDLSVLERQLCGTGYTAAEIIKKVSELDLNKYLPQMDKEVFCKLILE